MGDANKLKKDDMEKLKKEDQEAKQSLKDANKLSAHIKKETENAKNRLTRWINMFIFFIFPGITMKSFLALRCRRILDTDYLADDLSQECWGGALAISAIVIYAIGVPLFTWFSLYRSKAAMFDKKHPDYFRVNSRYGNLFQQYEPQFWYWEVIEMIRKLLLTGGLVLAADGTSAQFLIAQVISLLYLVLVIRKLPYENDTDDILQTLASVSILFTLMAGFAIKSEEQDCNVGTDNDAIYNKNIMGFVLVGINGFVFIFAIVTLGAIIVPCPHDCRSNYKKRKMQKIADQKKQKELNEKFKNRKAPPKPPKKKGKQGNVRGKSKSKVKPVSARSKSKSKVQPVSSRSKSKSPAGGRSQSNRGKQKSRGGGRSNQSNRGKQKSRGGGRGGKKR